MPCRDLKSPERPVTGHRIRAFALRWVAGVAISASPAMADQLWSVHAFGLKVGELRVAMQEDAATYSGQSQFTTTGLVRVLARIRFDIRNSGRKENGDLSPRTYKGSIDTGRRQSRTELDFSGPVPRKTAGNDTPAVAIPDADLEGAVDPMTMMWLTIGDRSAPLCEFERTQFDGTRLVAIRLTEQETTGSQITCQGIYDRLGGYTQEELDEITQSPLSITYEKQGETWRAVRVTLQSRHGPATLKRRN